MRHTLIRALRRLKQKEYQDENYWSATLENISILRDVVFTTIEGVIVLGALQAVLSKNFSVLLAVVYGLGWISLTGYLWILSRYLINATNRKWNLIENASMFAWIAGILPIVISFGITSFVSGVIAQFIATNFMGSVASG